MRLDVDHTDLQTEPAPGSRPGWRRAAAGSIAGLLVVGGGTSVAAADEHDGDDEGDGDGSGEVETAGLTEGLQECVAEFGIGKVVVVFDDPDFDPDELPGSGDGIEWQVVETQDGSPCVTQPPFIRQGLTFDDYESGNVGLGLQQVEFTPAAIPSQDGIYIVALEYQRGEDLDPTLEVSWGLRSFTFAFEESYQDCGGDSDGDGACAQFALENPIVLTPVTVLLGLDVQTRDEDGEVTDTPEGFTASLTANPELTLPDDAGETIEVLPDTTYTVTAEVPDGFELATCAEDTTAVATGVGEAFTATASGDHLVCIEAVAASEPAPEPDPEPDAEPDPEPEPEPEPVAVEADDTEELPETGAGMLLLTALGGALLAAGSALTRRRPGTSR
ncbi:MAG: LPXTG cell wall anchor domain-containing protein [Nitriliruptoraceae bacterium]|nr:LPXTG cell wall anchor domain-containing protein [Nitriliruptoraceae bacterium]